MSILTGFKKVKNYILTSSGYQLLSRWTSSQTVEFDDGKTAQAKLGEINGIAKTYVDMKKATDNSMAASAKAVMEGLENSSALISMTQAEYDALSDEERTDNNMRAILDANPDVVDAKNVNFDNTDTNLTATNTQSAITELNGKLGKYKLSTCGFFSINLVVGSNIVSVDKLVSGSLPQTPYTLFTVISQGTSLNRLIDIFFDGGNNVVAYTNVAQRYSIMWVSFELT